MAGSILLAIVAAVVAVVLIPMTKKSYLRLDANGMKLGIADRAIPWHEIIDIDKGIIDDVPWTAVQLPQGYPLELQKTRRKDVIYGADSGVLGFMDPMGLYKGKEKDKGTGFKRDLGAYYAGGKARNWLKELGAIQ